MAARQGRHRRYPGFRAGGARRSRAPGGWIARARSAFWIVFAITVGLMGITALAGAQDPDPATVTPAPALAAPVAPVAPGAQAGARRATPAPPPVAGPLAPPSDLSELTPWLDYKLRSHVAAFPHEARLFYRRGLSLHQSGAHEEAVRLVRGATELDPSFVAPHLTLASWFAFDEPSQALLQYAAVLELARQNFLLQLALAANALCLGLQALFIGLLVAALVVVGLHQRELRHVWTERVALFGSPDGARAWSWAFLVVPFALGFGLALPAVVFLGMLWPHLRVRERTLWILLVALLGALPWMFTSLDRLASPLREDIGPLYGVPMVENEAYSPERYQRLATLAAQHPDNGYLQFGLGWMARRGGDLGTAESAYRRAHQLWPRNSRVCNDLGNALAMQGRSDEALAMYEEATRLDRANAAAFFNAAQIHTQRFEYREATEAMSRASALNFDLVKSYQSQATDDGKLPLVDQWLAPATFWQAVRTAPRPDLRPAMPPAWRGHIESSGLRFSILAVVLALAGLGFGLWQHRALPLRTCSNCGNVVCRRCAERRRELALCASCAAVEARAESPEFARVLLLQHRRTLLARHQLARTALATLVPGLGLLSCRRVGTPLVLLIGAALLASGWLGLDAPFTFEPRLALSGAELPVALTVGLWALVYAVSILSYLAQLARVQAQEAALAAPVRSRSVQSTRRTQHIAA
jgi:tetratricopeptide (TPR) repeat protein